jgi:ribose transport system permease protein
MSPEIGAAVKSADAPGTPEVARPLGPAAASSPSPDDRARPLQHRVIVALERYALVILLVGLCVLFAVLPSTSQTFLTATNLRNLASGQAVTAIMALGALFPLVAGQFDVSLGAILGGSSMLLAGLTVNQGWPLGIALAATVIAAMATGLVNGWLVAYVGANSFVITLGAATLIGGLVSLASHDVTIVNVPQGFIQASLDRLLGIPYPVLGLIAAALVTGYVLRYTVYGRALLQTGINHEAARLVGLRTRFLILTTFVVAGAMAGLAGCLQLSMAGAGNPSIGFETVLPALAACFLGATTIRPGQFNVPGTLVGVFFVGISVNGLTLAGAADWVGPVFDGAAVVAAVAISSYLARRRGTSRA